MSEIDFTKNETDRKFSLFDNKEKNEPAPQTTAPVSSTTAQTDLPLEQTEDEKRRAHEEAEAKRKAEWEAKKKAREEETLLAWEKTIDVTDDQLTEISLKRIGDMTERLTRRNMKECIREHLQMLCYENMNLARNAMHPKKSMINCFKYINRKAAGIFEAISGRKR